MGSIPMGVFYFFFKTLSIIGGDSMDYLKYISYRLDLLLKYDRRRMLGESVDSYVREQIKIENEIKELDEKYPEYKTRYDIEKGL